MPPDHVDDYLEAAAVAGVLIAAPAVAEHWNEPSALVNWSVAGLAGHLARSVFTVQSALSVTVDPAQQVIDAVTYYAHVPDEVYSRPQRSLRTSGPEGSSPPGPGMRTWSRDTSKA